MALGDPGYPYAEVDDMLKLAAAQEAPLILLLDLIQDVHNLGSLLRTTAEAAGALRHHPPEPPRIRHLPPPSTPLLARVDTCW